MSLVILDITHLLDTIHCLFIQPILSYIPQGLMAYQDERAFLHSINNELHKIETVIKGYVTTEGLMVALTLPSAEIV